MSAVGNPYHDDKIFWPYHTVKALAIIRGDIPAPSLIEIDPSDEGCNQACGHCCFGSNPHRRIVLIDVGLLLSFLADAYACGTYAFELVGGGEPTNHPRVADIVYGIATLTRSGLELPHIGMVTNGVLLERIFSVAECFDFVRISLDAPEPDLYNRLHGVPKASKHYAKVIRNITMLISIIGASKVRIGYLVVPPHNHRRETILRTIALASELGVQHIAFRPAFLDRPVDQSMWQEAAATICEARRTYRPSFILGGTGGSWEYALGNREHPSGICRTRPLVLTIKADGTIPSCFLYRERLRERLAIGHISRGFQRVWFSEEHQRSIQAVERSTCPEFCKLFRADRTLDRLEKLFLSSGTIQPLADSEVDNPYFI